MKYDIKIAELIKIDGFSTADIAAMLEVPKDAGQGDVSLPCFRFSKILRKSPAAIADDLKNSIPAAEFVDRAESVSGYLNFFLNREVVAHDLDAVLASGEDYGRQDIGKGKTVCIDYSSVNIAKPFHIGHLSTTVIGAALYRIYEYLGYKTVGINHLGDWGTQFGKLIVAYKLWGNRELIEKGGITELNKIYVKFHEEAKEDPTLDDDARAWFKKIESGDKEAMELFAWFKEITLAEVNKIYERLHIKFDSYNGESFYNDKMQPVLDALKADGLLTLDDGAQIVDLSAYDMPPCMLVKADGATLYATRDLAAAFYRKQTYDFYKCLYVVAYQQNLHFKQFFKVLDLMGCDWAKDMVHVAFGMVSLEDGAMSTRSGRVVWLKDVLAEAVKKANDIILEKSPDIEDRESIAEKVGVGAVVFSALFNSRIKDIVFSYDKILNFDGETSPYIQYTYARCKSVLRKADAEGEGTGGLKDAPDFSALSDDASFEIMKSLLRFSDTIMDAADKYEPCFVSRFLVDLAGKYNRFYLENRILNAEGPTKKARLMLTKAVANVLKSGLNLLGIEAPEKM